jgi:hypothetical protein
VTQTVAHRVSSLFERALSFALGSFFFGISRLVLFLGFAVNLLIFLPQTIRSGIQF